MPKPQSPIPCASWTFRRSKYQAILETEHWSIHILQMTLELSSSEIFGFSAATLSTIAFLPQVIKTWKTRSAKDVSYALLLTFSTGCLCWVSYGYPVAAYPVMIANAFTLTWYLIILARKVIAPVFDAGQEDLGQEDLAATKDLSERIKRSWTQTAWAQNVTGRDSHHDSSQQIS